jgi:hypothetical protein
MPVEYSSPSYVPAFPGLVASALEVANEAARLLLPANIARARTVKDLDTGKSWSLVDNGDPTESADWICIGETGILAGAVFHDRPQDLPFPNISQAAENIGMPVDANLAAANGAHGDIGIPFLNVENERYETTTDNS